jgi:solute carrier family 8 (sodium/calcium exchanger)
VGEWKKSLVNHLYWSAVSTPDGDGEVIKAKWISLDNHIHDKHKNHGKIFPACKHKAIRKRGRKKKLMV